VAAAAPRIKWRVGYRVPFETFFSAASSVFPTSPRAANANGNQGEPMTTSTTHEPWWQCAVFYQVYPRSFASSTRGTTGDLKGITARLDYLAWLGVDAVWISPFFRSPMADFGYDVSDYCDVDPMFGTLADFDALVAAAHARGIKVVIDWVASHTSDQHPWFQTALRDPDSVERGFYHFAPSTKDGAPPNNWSCAFAPGTPAWSPVDSAHVSAADAPAGTLHYLHSFLPQQPDLNWHHPVLVERMHATLRFWLDRGVDGFRADVVHNLCKDATLADVDENLSSVPTCCSTISPRRTRGCETSAASSTATTATGRWSARYFYSTVHR
jgi:glycosidase